MSCEAATFNVYQYIVVTLCFCNCEWLIQVKDETFEWEIVPHVTSVDCNIAFTWYETYTRYCIFTTTCSCIFYFSQ